MWLLIGDMIMEKMPTMGLDRMACRQIEVGDAVLLQRAKTWCVGVPVVGRSRCAGSGSGSGKWEGFSKWLTAGKKGGREGKNGLRRFAEGGRETGQCRWGCHPSDQRAACERWNNFALSRSGLAARVPQLSPGTSTLWPHRVVGSARTSRLLGSQGGRLSAAQRPRVMLLSRAV